MAFCRNCGVQLNEGEKFCSNCGTSVDGAVSPQTSVTVSIDTKQVQDGLLRIKDAIIHLFKHPFKGTADAHSVLNPFSSYLFAVVLSLAYGLTALWTKAAVIEAIKRPFKGSGIFTGVSTLISAAFRFSSGKTFGLIFLTVLLSIAVVFGLLFLVSKVILKETKETTTLLNAAVFPFVLFLGITLVENIIVYISLKLYVIVMVVALLFLIIYLYHNIALVMSENSEHSPAAYVAALSFVCIAFVYNVVLLNNVAAAFTGGFQNILKDFM